MVSGPRSAEIGLRCDSRHLSIPQPKPPHLPHHTNHPIHPTAANTPTNLTAPAAALMEAKGVGSTGGVRLFAETRFNHAEVPDRGDTKAWRQRAAKGSEAEARGKQPEEKGESEG